MVERAPMAPVADAAAWRSCSRWHGVCSSRSIWCSIASSYRGAVVKAPIARSGDEFAPTALACLEAAGAPQPVP